MKIIFHSKIKTHVLIIILLNLYHTCSYAQSFHIGSNISLGGSWKNVNYGGGLEITAGYTVSNDLQIRTAGGIFNSDFDGSNVYLSTGTYILYYAEATLLYSLVSSRIVSFYGGGGIDYCFPHLNWGSHGASYTNVSAKTDFEPGFGLNLISGIKFNPHSLFSINFEIKYLYLNTEHTAIIHSSGNEELRQVETDLSTLTGKIGFVFNF